MRELADHSGVSAIDTVAKLNFQGISIAILRKIVYTKHVSRLAVKQ